MKKRSKNRLLTLVLVLVLVSVTTRKVQATSGTIIDANEGTTYTSISLSAGRYYLSGDVTLTNTLTVNTNTLSVWLDLNGYSISAVNGKDVISVSSGTLNIIDSGANGKITHSNSDSGDGLKITGGNVNMYGGSICDNSGRGVYVKNATFNLYGGTISGNAGGGIYLAGTSEESISSTFYMYGGVLSNNTGGPSGYDNVYAESKGAFQWKGGTIIKGSNDSSASTPPSPGSLCFGGDGLLPNTIPTSYIENSRATLSSGYYQLIDDVTLNDILKISGSVYLDLNGHVLKRNISGEAIENGNVIEVASSASLTLVDSNPSKSHGTLPSGGLITDGKTTGNGGGIYISGGGAEVIMYGGTICSNSATNGGGVYCDANNGKSTLELYAGSISSNSATTNGGGVFVNKVFYESTLHLSGGTISNNTSGANGGGIYVASSGTLTIFNSRITGNSASCGSGVYAAAKDVTLRVGSYISNNTTSNLFLTGDGKVKVNVSLGGAASVGITMESAGVFTSGTHGVQNISRFTSDDSRYTVIVEGGELKLVPTNYTIIYETAGGNAVSPQSYTYEDTITLPEAIKEGYTFSEWVVTSETAGTWTKNNTFAALAELSSQSGDATLTAQWTPAPLTGTVSLSGTEKYGQTLTAMYTGGNNTGTLTFQWKRGESSSDIGTESTYTLVEADIGNTLTCTVSSSEQTGSLTSSSTSVIGKAASPAAPSLGAEAPTSEGGSDGKITETTSLMEYSSLADFTSATPCSDTETTGLSAGPYYVRIKETSTTEAGIPASVTVPAYESPIVAVTSVTLDHSALTLIIGESGGSLTETISPSNATNKVVTWTSSDEDVVTVANGTLTAVASGIATITVTTEDGGFSASCVVTVTSGYPIWVNNVRITTANASNVLGDGTVSYNAASSTLTLNGATITGGKNLPGIRAGIYASGVDLIIHVTGSSTIHPTAQGDVLHSAIYLNSSESTLTITVDSGVTLTTIGPSPQLSHGSSHGIYTSGSIIITGSGTLDARSNYAPEGSTAIHGQNGVVVRSGTVNATGSMDYQGYGLNKLTIEGATASVTAVGYSKAVRLDTINPVQGTGWMTIDGSDAPTSIATNSEGNQLNYKKIQFPASSNALTISSTANGAIAVSANGSAITSGTNIAEGASVTTIATPNAGYHLGGLTYTPAGGEADAITSGSSFSMPDAATVISAAFAPNTYTISFNGNGNTGGSMSAQGFAYNAAQPLTANLFSRAGYNFAGWNTAANGSGITYSDRQSINNLTPENGATIVLYAQWTAQNTPPPTTPTSPTLDSSSSNDYGSSDDSGPYSPPVSQSTDSSNSASNDSVTVENSVSNADGSVSTTSTNRDGSTTTTTIGVDGSKSETTNKTEMTRSSDGSTTATTTETTAKAGDDGSKTESTSTSTTTTSETSDGGRSESTVSAQTTTTTAPDGTSLTTETKTETTIVVDKDGNGTVEGKTTETVKDSSGNITETSVTEIVGTVMTDVEGNKTTTTANTTTTTDAEGNERVTVTEEQVVEKKDGSVGKTVSDEAGNTISAEAVVSPIAVENAARERNPVVIPVSVSKGMDETSAPSVEITLPTLKEGVSISIVIPIAETTPTTVPVRVHSDGTSEIIKTSLSEDDGILLPLEKGETIKIIDNDVPLFDVPDSAWYSSAVDWAVSHGIMSGSGDGTFEPENPTTRGMMAQTIYNFDSIFVEGRNKFQDVTSDDWFYTAVTWATDEGVVVGYEDHTFRPNQDVTREELSLMLYRYADGKAASTDITHFVDSESVSPWASLAVQWAVDEGILRGSDNLLGEPTLAPRAPATRSEIAIMIMRYCETLLR